VFGEGFAVVREAPAILISDDDIAFRETLCGALEPEGYRTLEAGDGEQALHIVRSENVHLVLLDIHMPKLSGLEVMRLVRQFKSLLPCILLSADLDETLERQARMLRAFSVLAKPVSLQQVKSVVEMAIRQVYNQPEF
jgi:CheY-like chemotaxis protein